MKNTSDRAFKEAMIQSDLNWIQITQVEVDTRRRAEEPGGGAVAEVAAQDLVSNGTKAKTALSIVKVAVRTRCRSRKSWRTDISISTILSPPR